ncbi:DNA-methyltransferase [Xanthomonas graminis]|jgi:site-specific DNA-methyltransferase (adenine-specific)|uniref:Methyltransferase n=2 Tax=Xanthomonas translucens group TaxID=3390202 RepID=A0A1M4JB73_9XANT|nr:DNA methyltransferase [Xanthomonas translucens]EKU24254.1 DNA methylase N-4/N-6 domain-containing protein [Xanthomonas translucens pv. graminis ART-Xtg29]UKE54994.1 site-specific DNA-methyltransferase [Xanthomonas translucens pv. graminis]WIH09362.1 site-specific DNA-methyltransferase [Xanthomonas translucens pv. graminis]WIH12671.1 site-specific DNA-methyltransferase [Xanthomonas translucens pv. graminis]SBV43815.1 site-specific DNA-methyltransferase [Xanthomonas translucens pv. graminis]
MKHAPGAVRDSVIQALSFHPDGAAVGEIIQTVNSSLGPTPASSIRSYLNLNTPKLFVRSERGIYQLRQDLFEPSNADSAEHAALAFNAPRFDRGKTTLFNADCMDWLAQQEECSVHAVVTDPPYGLVEYSDTEQKKLRAGKGGIWRVPPAFDGSVRSPLPRFTVLTPKDVLALQDFFHKWGKLVLRTLVPGANLVVACNPLLSHVISGALAQAGLERRGEIARLVMTMRGGDRPKSAHTEFSEVSVMPRSMWEPWLVFRRPIEGRVQDNLRKWGTGGFRRPSTDKPFGDVIQSAPTRASERKIAPHPSLKPQAFMRKIVRAVLPLGSGIVCDPFAGSGATLAAAESVGYRSVGMERDEQYFKLACKAIPLLADLEIKS